MNELDPAIWFPQRPGDDGVLISRRAVHDWLTAVASRTDRLRVRTLGQSTEGRPIDAVFIADDLSGNRLDHLSDDREDSVAALLRGEPAPGWNLPVVLITSGIHATEVGGPQSIPELVSWLVFDDAPDVRSIRENVLTIVVPTLNPDGMDLVQRWHERTAGTERAGTLPPLLYHRHAGHDNNRDWIFRNLMETRVVLDTIHRRWLPHVTLDQHQMYQQGPRFVLPPYADPWEPNVHPSIIAASSALGAAIAADMTLAGKPGVVTGRYFDAWEPSRAIQHYRGGIRILAEAASANLAWPATITAEQLAGPPLPQQTAPATSAPLPWQGGAWGLRDIVDYHLSAARSLLRRVADEPQRWLHVQHHALSEAASPPVIFHVPASRPAMDIAANHRLIDILEAADLNRPMAEDQVDAGILSSYPTSIPFGRLTRALLMPKAFPDEYGPKSYDVTSHYLPLSTGGLIGTSATALGGGAASLPDGRWLVVDARNHRAPELAELARGRDPQAVLRATARTFTDGTLIDPGAWLVDRSAVPAEIWPLAHAAVDRPPGSAAPATRRDIVLLGVGDQPAPDHGWTRWWLEAMRIPFLEASDTLLGQLRANAATITVLIADTPPECLTDDIIASIADFLADGGQVIAFGRAGRTLATAISPAITVTEMGYGGSIHAPGALMRLHPAPGHPIALGLDRTIPAMFQRDGIFSVAAQAADVDVLGRFAARDTLVAGWMSDPGELRNAPVIVEAHHGEGRLHAFAFLPLFRSQMLVTSPLVHNLIYTTQRGLR